MSDLTAKMYSGQQRLAFRQLFHCDIRNFWSNLTGFDVIKFDEEVVKPADNVSTEAKLREEWGEEAVALIRQLLSV